MELFRNLPIGQYVPTESFLHRLDPRTKIVFVFVYVILIFFVQDLSVLSLYGILTFSAVIASRLSLSYFWRALSGMMIMIAIIGILQLFLVKKGELLFSWSWISIYSGGVERAIFVSLRLLFLVIITSLLTLTTSPISLTDGLERLLKPFAKLGLPVYELALMMSIAIRYIPTLMDETDKIIKAQTARGADFESGNLIRRTKALFPLLVPLFVSSFRRAEELAFAMEARCYRGGVGRTRRMGLKTTWRDLMVSLVMVTLVTLTILTYLFL